MYEPDPNTIRAAAGGDHRAFEELVRGYQAQVWRFLRHMVGDAALAEDLTQETFIRMYRKMDGFRFRSKFSTWVYQVARNTGIDALRSRKRRDRLVEVLRPSRAVQPGPETRVEVEEAVAGLSPKLREAFLMIEVLGLTYRETATALDIPEGTAKTRVHLARRQLAAWLTEARDGPADEG